MEIKEKIIIAECESGVCPICGGSLDYAGSNKLEGFHYWACRECNATGKEGFNYIEGEGEDDNFDAWDDTEFDGQHYDVRLEDGTFVEIISPDHPDAAKLKEKRVLEAVCESGVCPLCGGDLEYNGEPDDQDGGCVVPWTCTKCGATGEEGREEIFNGEHYEVHDINGAPVEIVPPASERQFEESVCPFCGQDYRITSVDDTYEDEKMFWRCDHCGATGTALYHAERIFDGFEDLERNGLHLEASAPGNSAPEIKSYQGVIIGFDDPLLDDRGMVDQSAPYVTGLLPENNPTITFDMVLDLIDAHRCHDGIKTNDDDEILVKGSQAKVDAMADLLMCMGLDVVTGYYDPKEDAAHGACDAYTGYRYIRVNGQ